MTYQPNLDETFRFTFDGDTIVSAEVVEDGETEDFELRAGEELVRVDVGVVHFRPKPEGGWKWTLYLEAEPGVWFERADGYGRIGAELVAEIALDGVDVPGDGEGDEGGEDGGGKDDDGCLIGGDRFWFNIDESGEQKQVVSVWQWIDGVKTQETISPDETYTVLADWDGDWIIKAEQKEGGIAWEVYANDPDNHSLFIEVASGFGDAPPSTIEEILLAIENEDGVAEDIEGDDDDRFEGGDEDDEFECARDDGDDDYIGGGGRDKIRFEGEDGVHVDLRIKGHQDTGRGYDSIDGVEDLDGGDGDDVLTGDFVSNSIKGGKGDDVQNGNGGNDDLWGDLGDDSLVGGGGSDTIGGGHGADDIDCGTGADTTSGGFGDDDVDGQDGDDKIDGNSGRDTLNGGAGSDNMAGGDDADELWGGTGNDVLRGGKGGDHLHGGAGRDVFVFKAVAEGGLGRVDDVIADFVRGQDKIDLRAFDLDYIGRADFSGVGDAELRLEGFTGGVRVFADVDGDGRADFSMEIHGNRFMAEADFML